MENEGLFEGDIMGIEPDQDRNAVPKDSQRWPNGTVVYLVDEALYPIWETIMLAMRHIEEKTCIKFVHKDYYHRNYVKIFKGNGCWSQWGFYNQGEQRISLGDGCSPFGTVVHELLHTIGFEHEHNRSDRDDYLTINWHNIDTNWYYAFKKLLPDQNRLYTPFDYDSIMLYGETAFSREWGLKSMEAKDGRYLKPTYEKEGMSDSDVKRLNMLYNC
ncbi:Astacin-like metalloprotease toxin, partial [Stegodyphus mimosarum]